MTPPRPSSALPPRALRGAVPKGISGRASYLQVCLVFRSEPRVIAALFNGLPFGPPRGLTPASACPRLDHLGFGSAGRDWAPSSGSLSLRLRDSNPLASPRPATRRLILQKARHHPPRGRDILPVCGFRYSFTPLAGVLFAFPSRYSFPVGSPGVFSLGSWSTRIRAGFLVPRPTQVPRHGDRAASRTRLSRPTAGLPMPFRCAPVFP